LVLPPKLIGADPGDLTLQERNQQDADALFTRAIGTGLFEKDVEELVILYEARAGFHRREIDGVRASLLPAFLPTYRKPMPILSTVNDGEEGENGDLIELVVTILREGIKKVQGELV
jgi:hypothetical protein